MIATQTPPAARQTDSYLKAFERLVHSGAIGTAEAPPQFAWVLRLRKAGIARFTELGFPTVKQEDWRFTNVAPIAKLPAKLAPATPAQDISPEVLTRFPFTRLTGPRLVFVDGHYASGLSNAPARSDGVRVVNLATALTTDSALLEKHLGRHARIEQNPFAALNNAFFLDGGFIHVPADVALESPVQLLFINTGQEHGAANHPRTLIVAERGARATIVESHVSLAKGGEAATTLTNAVTEFVLADHAEVEHCKFQDESAEAYHLATLHSHLGRAVNFSTHSIVTGAKLSRNHLGTTLDGEGIEAILNGVYLTNGDQLADHYMVVDHAKPNCASHEYFNGILAGKSKGVFHGRILVRPDAQKTDAKQTNKNLLLSDDASADTKPQLEIYADDVKCTHGATIGQLNEASIYYLRSRGIGLEKARRMLIHAFAGEIIDRVKHDAIREELDGLVWDRLEQLEGVALE